MNYKKTTVIVRVVEKPNSQHIVDSQSDTQMELFKMLY